MSDDVFGQQGLTDDATLLHQIYFLIKKAISEVRTAHPTKVVAVTGGGVGAAPTVDLQPLVKQMDGIGQASSHETVYGRPVTRIQGGTNAFICDPVVGDVGHMVVSDRDISSVAANAAEANPGSYRRHDFADGVYHGAMLNKAAPTNYINLNGGVIIAQSGDTVTVTDGHGNVVKMQSDRIYVKPGSMTIMIYLGGDGTTGSYDFVSTMSGPCLQVKGRYA